MVESNWKPTGWLGIVVAGALWNPIEKDNIDACVQQLLEQIKHAVPTDFGPSLETDGGWISHAELRAELERLRDGLAQNSASQSYAKAQVTSVSNASLGNSCAKVPPGVPLLPNDYKETETVLLMRQILLRSRDDPEWTRRCGFYGMGGLGKTVTGGILHCMCMRYSLWIMIRTNNCGD